MEDLPQLEPLSLRLEGEPGDEKESWKPTWKCYCCEDTGFVLDRLSSQIIPGFSSDKHKTLLCKASGCNASRDKVSYSLIEQGNFDTRLTPQICDRLSEIERESWSEYRWQQQKLRQKALGLIEEAAQRRNWRLVKRTREEQKQAKERHLRIVRTY